jgi:multiple sugar transport system substrate-binding protein
MSLSAYSNNKETALDFLKWFVRDDIQLKWAKMGGLSSNKAVMVSEDFLQAEPFNEAFIQSLPLVKDFYNTPDYVELLAVTQDKLYAAVQGNLSPQAVLDAIAGEHTSILSLSSNAKGWELY